MATVTAAIGSPHSNEAFADLMSAAKPIAARICRRYRIPPQDAEDLMQQSLMALIDGREQVENPEAWLAGTLRNHCLMYWRRRRRRLYSAVDTAILETLAEPTRSEQDTIELSHDMASILGDLPSRCRSVLELRYGLGCRPLETAKRLGYRSSSIYKILQRCLAALSRRLTASGLAAETAPPAGVSTQCQVQPPD
ncbi:MAG: sigma-70 family RNA polymerase sigma factor [bacterium]|nr:sigma-70 family RNA polymerase sigma factor [bacterium]